MKNILSVLLIAACIIYSSSCKPKDSKPDQTSNENSTMKTVPTHTTTDSDSLLAMIKNMTKIKPEKVKEMKEAAEVILEHRNKEGQNKSYIILDKQLWEYEFIFTGKKMSGIDQFAGYWIDFSEDLTYEYGHYQDVLGSGRYTYSLASGLLLLIDNSDKIKPQEFEAKLFDVTLVMDGNNIYQDHNYNAKLKRITERPNK